MKKKDIRSITRKRWKPASTGKQEIQDRVNLLNQDASTTSINQKWVTDITYIYTKKDGWCYFSSIQDLHSRKIIAWKLSKNMTTQLVLDTLNDAIFKVGSGKELILHSDLGSQYTSNEYEKRLEDLGIRHSYSKKGYPYDNAWIESFHSILKREEVYQKDYQTFEEARISLFQYVEGFYNQRRIHGSIGYLTPNQMQERALVA